MNRSDEQVCVVRHKGPESFLPKKQERMSHDVHRLDKNHVHAYSAFAPPKTTSDTRSVTVLMGVSNGLINQSLFL